MNAVSYKVEIRRLGCGWESMPFGSLKDTWKCNCEGKVFTTLDEAVAAMADMWYDLESDDVIRECDTDNIAEPLERMIQQAYKEAKEVIAETRTYGYDDGECRIVECG